MKACYVHVPFCKDICSYCDFTRCRYHAGLCDKWLTSIHQEIDEKLKESNLETLYIGGGTPSCLSNIQLKKLLSYLQPYTMDLKEYTIEANVESLTKEKLFIMKEFGVNRLSLGVQTLQECLLHTINRHHSREEVLEAIASIHGAGIYNISIDLIYGLPGQTMALWQKDLQDIITSFPIQHISLYSLTIEEHSVFGRTNVQSADESLEADMFEYAIDVLSLAGFEHYEISNFAKEDMRSKHNQMYWNYEDFVGIGCGASGKEHHVRYDNTRNLQVYFDHGASPERITLSKENEMFETVMMTLRTKDGLSLEKFKQCFGVDFCTYFKEPLKKQVDSHMLLIENGYVHATHKGMLLLNDILVDFLD